MSVLVAGVVVGAAGAYASYSASEDAADATAASIEANYQYDMENYRIQQAYHKELLAFRDEQDAYAQKQLDFAYQQLSYANEQYNIGLRNIAEENNFRQKEVYNTKLAALTEYNAQADVGQIMKQGAEDSMNNAINETLRVQGANQREIARQADKALGTIQATRGAGITGGASVERDKIAMFMEKNRAISMLSDKTAASIIETSAQKTEMVNNYNLKIAEAYRMLDATMRLEAAPVAMIPGPQPIFTEKQPIGPITPLSPEPIKGVAADSGWSSLASGISGFSSGFNVAYNVGTAIK